MHRFLAAVLLALALIVVPAIRGADGEKPPSPAAVQFFESKVRPILVESCFKCHGAKKQRGGLRVDSRAALLEGGDQGPALVPGHPEKSLLLKAVSHEDKDLKMPPSQKLRKEQIADLARWVKLGAPWPGGGTVVKTPRKGEHTITDKDRTHWAFQPIQRPAPPVVKNAGWVTNPIDALILARLEAKGLAPSPPASKRELVRRLYYDLTGLPPTPAQVEAFANDSAPDAYTKLVDQLLESPRYGEKWGRHWLDLVHYAETNSYERDNPKPHVWRYRDYVIRSFNADKPFDQFIKEQLAGDELPRKSADALIATGYYRLGIWDDEPSDPLQARYDMLDDIVATTGQVFLGLTFDCARCHNHKIDPIPQKDYYRLLAFFHNVNHYRNGGPTDEAPLLPDAETQRRLEVEERQIEQRRRELQTRVAALEKEFRVRAGQAKASIGTDLTNLGYRLYQGAWTRLPDFDRLKPTATGKLPTNLFDLVVRPGNDNFGLVFEGTLLVPAAGKYTFHLDSDDGSRLTINSARLIEHDGIHGVGKEHSATVALPAGRVPVRLDYFQGVYGLGLKVAWSGPGFERRPLSTLESGSIAPIDFAEYIRMRGAQFLGRERYTEYVDLKRQIKALQRRRNVSVERCLCVTEAGRSAPPTHVLIRGNPHVKGDRVEPGFPVIFNLPEPKLPEPTPTARSSGRRTVLANWIASPENPMTARVIVNRVWQQHFGRGIVRTPNDFGLQGSRPTHPELLDWLATELIAKGWRLKALHRIILTSSAYRMSSRGNPAALAADPANDLFWRFDMRRLTAEEIRDSILAVGGTLNLKMYGPGVYPSIPKEVLAGQSVPGRGWGRSSPEEAARRSVYVHVKRSLLLPILESFDVAETDRTTPVRFATTQPTQALGMLNGEFLHEQAAQLARRLKREAGADATRQVRLALSLVTQRPPTDTEVRRGVALIEALRTRDGASPEVALNTFCLVALNLNEFVYLD